MFTRFPNDVTLKQSWCRVISDSNETICKGFGLVCHRHFLPNDKTYTTNNKIRLLKNAIPCHSFPVHKINNVESESEEIESHSNNNGLSNELHFKEVTDKDMEIVKLKDQIRKLEDSNEKYADEKKSLKTQVQCLKRSIAEIQKKYKVLEETFMQPKSRFSNVDNVNMSTYIHITHISFK